MDNNIRMIIEREERLSSILNNINVDLLLQGPNSEIFMSNEKALLIRMAMPQVKYKQLATL